MKFIIYTYFMITFQVINKYSNFIIIIISLKYNCMYGINKL